MAGLGGVYADGRAVKAVNLQHINKLIRQTQAEINDLRRHEVSQQQTVEDDVVNMIEHDFESYLCDSEFKTLCRVDEIIMEWKKAQCRQVGLSRKALLGGNRR